MSNKSFLDYAYDVIVSSKEPVPFKELFEKVVKLSGRTLSSDEVKSEMAKLYTRLSMDGRFACFNGNNWDLRSKHEYKDSYVDLSQFSSEDDESGDEEEKKLLREELGEDDTDSDKDSGELNEENEENSEEEEF